LANSPENRGSPSASLEGSFGLALWGGRGFLRSADDARLQRESEEGTKVFRARHTSAQLRSDAGPRGRSAVRRGELRTNQQRMGRQIGQANQHHRGPGSTLVYVGERLSSGWRKISGDHGLRPGGRSDTEKFPRRSRPGRSHPSRASGSISRTTKPPPPGTSKLSPPARLALTPLIIGRCFVERVGRLRRRKVIPGHQAAGLFTVAALQGHRRFLGDCETVLDMIAQAFPVNMRLETSQLFYSRVPRLLCRDTPACAPVRRRSSATPIRALRGMQFNRGGAAKRRWVGIHAFRWARESQASEFAAMWISNPRGSPATVKAIESAQMATAIALEPTIAELCRSFQNWWSA